MTESDSKEVQSPPPSKSDKRIIQVKMASEAVESSNSEKSD